MPVAAARPPTTSATLHVTTYANASRHTSLRPRSSAARQSHQSSTTPSPQRWAKSAPGCAITGLDFAAPIGTPVRAALAGTVTHAGYCGAAGSWAGDYVTIRHADGTSTLYAHMSATYVVEWQSVMTGQRIG